MFRHGSVPVVAEVGEIEQGLHGSANAADFVPVSLLALDLADEPPAGGWIAYLAGRGIPIVSDHIGRPSIDSADARQLLDERREAEVRRREAIARNEQRAIEAYEQQRASIWTGLPADSLPVGVSAGDAMAQAAQDAQPKRQSPMEEAFSGKSMVYHAWPNEDDAA
jgi:hypothetical protein